MAEFGNGITGLGSDDVILKLNKPLCAMQSFNKVIIFKKMFTENLSLKMFLIVYTV